MSNDKQNYYYLSAYPWRLFQFSMRPDEKNSINVRFNHESLISTTMLLFLSIKSGPFRKKKSQAHKFQYSIWSNNIHVTLLHVQSSGKKSQHCFKILWIITQYLYVIWCDTIQCWVITLWHPNFNHYYNNVYNCKYAMWFHFEYSFE